MPAATLLSLWPVVQEDGRGSPGISTDSCWDNTHRRGACQARFLCPTLFLPLTFSLHLSGSPQAA